MKAAVATPQSEIKPMPYPRIGLHINGKWIYERESDFSVYNPSNEQLLGTVPCASEADLNEALAAAGKGFERWRTTQPEVRARIIKDAMALMLERKEEIAHTITLEQGKPLADSRAEVMRASSFLEWDSEQALRVYGDIMPSSPQMQRHLLKLPIGPVAAFTPWNVPISSPARKLSGALAAGCSVILKPAEETPGAAYLLAQCFIDAGLPPGVLQLVYGDPASISSVLIASPAIRMITLTGSVPVGKQLARLAGAAMKPAIMELGGHAPVLIGEGVDATAIAQVACTSKMRMAGQICASPTRFLIHHSIYEEFVRSFANAAGSIRVGDGFEPGVQMGPLMNRRRVAEIEKLVLDAKEHGANVVAGGYPLGEQGYFYAPTVLSDIPLKALAMSHEPFGPLALCMPVNDLNQALNIANSLPLGLSGYAFTNSLSDAARISEELECGVLSINHFGAPGADAPFGGVKDSGIGREGGAGSLDPYMVTKTVLQRTAPI